MVELLVVIAIMGILASIAIPAFLSQRDKAYNGEAKSMMSDLIVQIEGCFVETHDYEQCDSPEELGTTGLPVVAPDTAPAAGEVAVGSASAEGYRVRAMSRSGTLFEAIRSVRSGGSGLQFGGRDF